MSTLTSSSTDAEVWAAYDDNASYAEDASVAKARAFETACRFLLRRLPKTIGKGEDNLGNNPELIQAEMKACQQWLRENDTTRTAGRGEVRTLSTRYLR